MLARYRRFVDHLLAIGLEPVITLFHYTHPRWFHETTPWTTTAAVAEFGRFAGRVAAALGHRVRFWVILNEPLVFLLAGYVDGQIPPGAREPRSLERVFDHLLAAHCLAAGRWIRRGGASHRNAAANDGKDGRNDCLPESRGKRETAPSLLRHLEPFDMDELIQVVRDCARR